MSLDHLKLFGAVVAALVTGGAPHAHADNDDNTLVPNNKRLNDGVVANVYTVRHHSGCAGDIEVSRQLQLAAQRYTEDILANRSLDGQLGSDGSTPQSRAESAGFRGQVAQTVAVNPALAINNVDVINQWYSDPAALSVISNCTYSQMGVWSLNSLDRSVLVAVYGMPSP